MSDWCENTIVAEGEVLPANGVSVVVRSPPTSTYPGSRNRREWLFLVTRGLLPLVVIGLLAGLLLGGIGAVLVVIGVALIVGVLWLGVRYREAKSRELYTESSNDWMSRTAFYEGPFDETGLRGAGHFERQHSIDNNPPQVRLVVTPEGLSFGPAGHSGDPLKVPFTELESVTLSPGTRKRMLVVTPPIANRLGTVELTTTDGRVARFTGIPPPGPRGGTGQTGRCAGVRVPHFAGIEAMRASSA